MRRVPPEPQPDQPPPHLLCAANGESLQCSGAILGGEAIFARTAARDPDRQIEPSAMHTLVMFTVAEGAGELQIAGSQRRLQPYPGFVLLLPAQLPLLIRLAGQVATVQLSFVPRRLAAGAKPARLLELPVAQGRSDPVLECLMATLHHSTLEGGALQRLIDGVLNAACGHLGVALAAPRGTRQISDLDLQRLDALIAEHADLAPPAAAALLGLPQCRFERELRARTGQGFAAFVRDTRLRLAYRALCEGAACVTEVAQRFGFFDASHFSHAFRSRYGTAPSRVRG